MRAAHPAMILAMKTPNLDKLRTGDILQDSQAGGPLNAFDRGARLRHARLGTWWERVLAVLSLVFVVATAISLVLRSL